MYLEFTPGSEILRMETQLRAPIPDAGLWSLVGDAGDGAAQAAINPFPSPEVSFVPVLEFGVRHDDGSVSSTVFIPEFSPTDLANFHIYRTALEGSVARIYVDDVLKVTHTTNVSIGKPLRVLLARISFGTVVFLEVDYVRVTSVTNQPPVCSAASASPDTLWPPNHHFVAIDILGVTDPDGDAVTITVDSIFQDEAIDAPGSGNTAPDGHGGTCSGVVLVGVPKSQGKKGARVDDGAVYDSTVVP